MSSVSLVPLMSHCDGFTYRAGSEVATNSTWLGVRDVVVAVVGAGGAVGGADAEGVGVAGGALD